MSPAPASRSDAAEFRAAREHARQAAGGNLAAHIETSQALTAAINHITELERENEQLRLIVSGLAVANRMVA